MLELQNLKELKAQRLDTTTYKNDIVRWAETNFYIPRTEEPVVFMPHQKCIYRLAYTRDPNTGRFPYQTQILSTVKQSGKSTGAGIVTRWMAETETRFGELFCVGNDQDQAKDRSFREIRWSIELAPGYNQARHILPKRWNLRNALTSACLATGSEIKAIAVDSRGSAGGKPALSVWTELWGFTSLEAKRFWDEMTPVPTVPDSLRLVETYAGYDGESELLQGLYDAGLKGRHLTAHDLALAGARDYPGESYEELLYAFAETKGDPDAHVPVWVNEDSSLVMYWDSEQAARRMPWQHTFTKSRRFLTIPRTEEEKPEAACTICRQSEAAHNMGMPAAQYYSNQEQTLPPKAFERFHFNRWVGAESSFIPIESWDSCYDPEVKPILPGNPEPIVLSIDAATSHDCFAITAVSRNKRNQDHVDVRACKKWTPEDSGGQIKYADAENWLRLVISGGCVEGHGKTKPDLDCAFCRAERWDVPPLNVIHICYDPFQMESMMQDFRREFLAWCMPFPQNQDRLKADRQLYDMILQRRIHHRENPADAVTNPIREHLLNANARLQKDQDSTMRIVKRVANKRIDLAVSLSMAVARCLYLVWPE